MPEKIAKQKGSPNFQPLLKIFFCTPYGNQNVCGMEQCWKLFSPFGPLSNLPGYPLIIIFKNPVIHIAYLWAGRGFVTVVSCADRSYVP